MDVAEAIDAEAIEVSHIRRPEGTYTDGGRGNQSEDPPEPIAAVIQPVGRQLMDLPEGKRDEAKWLYWSRVFVEENDIILIPRHRTIVLHVWERDEDGFCRAALGKVKQQ